MLVFHGKRWIAGCELVGIKTCGSTLSNACSRSLIAYLAKSAAVAYGEVDCSSPKSFGTTKTARLRQTARSLLITNAAIFYPISGGQASRIFLFPECATERSRVAAAYRCAQSQRNPTSAA